MNHIPVEDSDFRFLVEPTVVSFFSVGPFILILFICNVNRTKSRKLHKNIEVYARVYAYISTYDTCMRSLIYGQIKQQVTAPQAEFFIYILYE
jgi:hypothetical protein